MYDAATREVLSDSFGYAIGDYSNQTRPYDGREEVSYEFSQEQEAFYEAFIETGKELQKEIQEREAFVEACIRVQEHLSQCLGKQA